MNKKIYVGMTADIMHPGLIHIIHEATKYGDVIVGLLTDKAIAEHKRLPYLTYDQRKEVVENIKGVCEVVPQEDWSYVPNLEKLKPDYIIHGDDWKTGPLREVREQVFEVMDAQGARLLRSLIPGASTPPRSTRISRRSGLPLTYVLSPSAA